MYNPLEAHCVFIEGPVALFIHRAARRELEEAYATLGAYLAIAIDQFELSNNLHPDRADAGPSNDRGRGAGGEGG